MARLSRCRRMAAIALAGAAIVSAQPYGRPQALREVGIDQRLNYDVPLDLKFRDEAGRSVRLGDLFRGKPVVLSLVYYQCPMLCNLVLNGEVRGFRKVPLELGADYDAITVSFDPKETPEIAAAKKANYIEQYNRPGADRAWHFLTGEESQVKALAAAVGFRYHWDEATRQWAHASGIMVLTPQGRISRYLFGIEYPNKDLKLALVESSAGKIGSIADQVLLFCYHYDPLKGKYTFAVMNSLRAGATATLLGIGLFMFISFRRDRRAKG